MPHSGTIPCFSFKFFLFTLVTRFMLTANGLAWSQSAPATVSASTSLATNTPVQTVQIPSAILIGSGDLLKVSVFGAPESDQDVRVDPDGNISLNFIGAVHVAGLSGSAAQDLIA